MAHVKSAEVVLVGQLLVGVVLGPTLLGPYLGLATWPAEFTGLQLLATVFVLFLAGLEVNAEQVLRMPPMDFVTGVAVFSLPFLAAAGAAFLLFPGTSLSTVLFISLTLSITALPVMSIMLASFGLSNARFGQLMMNAALVNELVAVTVFAVLLGSGSGEGWTAYAMAVAAVLGFLAIILAIYFLMQYLRRSRRWDSINRWFRSTWRSPEGGFALLMVLLLGSTLLSQSLGLTYVVGAFYAGLLVTRESVGSRVHATFSTVFTVVTWGFFVPLFFVFVGVEMTLTLLGTWTTLGLFGALLAVAALSKIGVGYGVVRARGWGPTDAAAAGFLLASRGAVELAMAVILYQSGIFNETVFTIIAGVGLVTSIIAPMGALWAWRSDPQSREELCARAPQLRPGSPRQAPRFPSGWATDDEGLSKEG